MTTSNNSARDTRLLRTRPPAAIVGNYEPETLAYCKRKGWQDLERVEGLVRAARERAHDNLARHPVGVLLLDAVSELANVQPSRAAYLSTVLAELNRGNIGGFRRVIAGSEWAKRALRREAKQERELKREAQRLIAEGMEKTFNQLETTCTLADWQLWRDIKQSSGSLRAIGKLRKERKEKSGRCHPNAVARDMKRLSKAHPALYLALTETKDRTTKTANVGNVDMLRTVKSKTYGERYQREQRELQPQNVVELKDTLAEYVEGGDLDKALADVVAWAKDQM